MGTGREYGDDVPRGAHAGAFASANRSEADVTDEVLSAIDVFATFEPKLPSTAIGTEEGRETDGVLVAIPAFNEEKTIGSLVLAAQRYAEEVVVVDDGSTDDTSWIAQRAGARIVRHPYNRGYGAALRSAFDYARNNGTKALVVLDGDGQHRPEQIPRVVGPVLRGQADICIGSRFLSRKALGKVPRYRRFGIRVLTGLTNVGSRNSKLNDAQSGFRAYSRKTIDTIDPAEAGMGASAEILWDADKRGLSVREVSIEVDYDVDTSTHGPVRHALGVVVSMLRYIETEHALLAFGLPGAVLFVLGLALGISVLEGVGTGRISSNDVLGRSLVTSLFITLGMMLSFTALVLHAVINANRRMR